MDDKQHYLVNDNYTRDSLNDSVSSGSDTVFSNHRNVGSDEIGKESSHQQLQETKNNSDDDKFSNSEGIGNCEVIEVDVDKPDLIIKGGVSVTSANLPLQTSNNSDNILKCGNSDEYQNNTCNIDSYEKKISGFSNSVREDSKTNKPSRSSTPCNALSSLLVYGGTSSSSSDDDDDDDNNINNNNRNSGGAVRNECQNTNSNNVGCEITSNSGVNSFGDMSLRFPRTQQVIDDDLLSLSSYSSTDSSTSLIFSVNSDVSDDDYDDEFDSCDENGSKGNRDKKNYKTAVAEGNNKKPSIKKKEKPSVTQGELLLEDLPAIKDLHITVPQEQCVLLGNILNIVDKLVIVQALKDLPALDLDTVLFLEWDKPLGKVFDVFGPVIEPLYCIRFNSNEHVQEKNISVGMPVYFVPKFKCTKYVFVAQLMKMKGSDASWENNNEPPLEFIEYSDDEQERKAKKLLKKIGSKKKKESDDPERNHPTAYEKRMNQRNLKMSEMQLHQSQNKKSRKRRNQLIRPSSFMASEPDSNFYSNSTSSGISDIDIKPFADIKKSFPASQQNSNSFHNVSNLPFCSPMLPDYSASISHQPFQSHCNQNFNLIPNRPNPLSPWSVPPTTFNNNTFASPQQSPALPLNLFSSPPPRFLGTPGKPTISTGVTSFHAFNDFSSPPPPPNFSYCNQRFSSLPCHSELSASPSQRLFSPFPNNNEIISPSFCPATPPPNSSNLFSSRPPPPAPLPQNVNHSVMNLSNPPSFSNSCNGNLFSDSRSAYNNTTNLSQTSLPGRLHLPPQQNSNQNRWTFQNNFQ